MAGRAELLRAALRRIFSSLPEDVSEAEARAIRSGGVVREPTEEGDNWFRRQYDMGKRERDLGETADNLGSIQMPEVEVPQSPYDDWLSARRHVLPEMIEANRSWEAANGPSSVEQIIGTGTHPHLSNDLPQAIGADLGPYAVGGRLENFPILAVPAGLVGVGALLRELQQKRQRNNRTA